MTNLTGKTLNELTFKICKNLLTSGNVIESRVGKVYELCDIELFLAYPQNRHLYLEGRKNNIYACFAETIWVMAGRKELDPLMNFFLPRAKNFSDDGGLTWYGSYGSRLYYYDQIDSVIKTFLRDGKNTRRAVMTLWNPKFDSIQGLKEHGIEKPNDQPCNDILFFWIRDNKLNLKIGTRSNDGIWGFSGINVFEFTFLQEVILRLLQYADPETYDDVELGYYHTSVISLHIYDFTAGQAENIIDSEEANFINCEFQPNFPIELSNKINSLNVKDFFGDIYTFICDEIRSSSSRSINDLFLDWNVSLNQNQLYYYVLLANLFIKGKYGKLIAADRLLIDNLPEDLKLAVKNSSFTPKELLPSNAFTLKDKAGTNHNIQVK